jgi:hypothetical protein
MSLSTIAGEVRTELGSLQDHAQDDYNRIRAAIEEKLPEFERVGALIDKDPLFQLAYGEFVPAPLRQLAADAVITLVHAFNAAPAPAPAAASEPDPPAAPAEPETAARVAP